MPDDTGSNPRFSAAADARITGGFMQRIVDRHRTVTVPDVIRKIEAMGAPENYRMACGDHPNHGFRRGVINGTDDVKVCKTVEGVCRLLLVQDDGELRNWLDRLIDCMIRAQREDGYVCTRILLGEQEKRVLNPIGDAYQTYIIGHYIEAMLAYYALTGADRALTAARKAADRLLVEVRERREVREVPSHSEVEHALLALYETTGATEYLHLARTLLDNFGHHEHTARVQYGIRGLDRRPLTEQTEANGHCVRANHVYMALADLGRMPNHAAYAELAHRMWDSMVSTKLLIHGGVGTEWEPPVKEGYGEPYYLPDAPYAETCAAITLSLWSQRMFRLEPHARYWDVIERTFYNAILAAISQAGDRYYYCNPLVAHPDLSTGRWTKYIASRSFGERKVWFPCPCCPPNLVRYLARLPSMACAVSLRDCYVNLYMEGTTRLDLDGGPITIRQRTAYPWNGRIVVEVDPRAPVEFRLHLRVPGWSIGRPVPGDLYEYDHPDGRSPSLYCNGAPAALETRNGYAMLQRTWRPGDTVTLDLPMPVRRVRCHPKAGRDELVALERGPVLYCAEGHDNGGDVFDLALPDDAPVAAAFEPDLFGGVVVVDGQAQRVKADGDAHPVPFRAIPYFLYANRGDTPMAVFLPRRPEFATAEHVATRLAR